MPALTHIYTIGNFIDTYALGHYARVLDATDLRDGRQIALKVMRPEHCNPDDAPRWEAQAFVHEADLLKRLSRSSTAIRFYDCGYLSTSAEYPADGEIVSYGTSVDAFREGLFTHNAKGWRPYLALENLPRHHNLLYLMKPTHPDQHRRLPTEEALNLAMQFGKLLFEAHELNIFYMDHKLEHVYWDGQKLRIIDWNSSKWVDPNGVQVLEQTRRKDLHNLCVGILYPIFTGRSPQRGDLRPQPAGQQDVDARYADINHLDFSGEPTLSSMITDLLELGARQDLNNASAFLQQVEKIATHFGWEFRFEHTDPTLLQAREHVQLGLKNLRDSTELARQAREALLEAATLEGINEDMESEIRRLLKDINDYLNARVIP